MTWRASVLFWRWNDHLPVGFIVQLEEHYTNIAEAMGLISVQAWLIFGLSFCSCLHRQIIARGGVWWGYSYESLTGEGGVFLRIVSDVWIKLYKTVARIRPFNVQTNLSQKLVSWQMLHEGKSPFRTKLRKRKMITFFINTSLANCLQPLGWQMFG